MNFIYPDDEASRWAERIYSGLLERRCIDEVKSALALQEEIETEVMSAVASMRVRYDQGQYEELLAEVLPLYKGDMDTYNRVFRLLESVRRGDAHSRAAAEDVLGRVLQELAGEDVYRFSTPLDLMVALDALFRATVLATQLREAPQRIMREQLGCEIDYGDAPEVTNVNYDHGNLLRDFAEMLNSFSNRFGFGDLLQAARSEVDGAVREGAAMAGQDAERRRCIAVLEPMVKEVYAA